MFGHKCFLRIGQLEDSSASGLYKYSYELLSCTYGFGQSVDRNGKPQSEVQGGTLNLVFPNVPPNDFISWMLKSSKLEDGAIVICDANDLPIEKVYFEGAACTQMNIDYVQEGDGYITTSLVLEARKLTVGSVSLEKNWVNLK